MDLKTMLQARGVLVADGAWGTLLWKRGLAPGTAPERWNLERPDEVEAVARAYVEAGAQIVLTNTFGGSRWKLARAGLGNRTAEVNRRGVELSKRAAGGRALVFASIGPTGDFVAPLGTRTEKEFLDCFAEQVAACADGGADGLVIETMTALDEARAALVAARRAAPALPVAACMTFDRGARGYATMMGVTPERAARELDAAGADLLGSNCGTGIAAMVEVARLMKPATARPLWIKPNAGAPRLVDGRTVFRETPQEMAAHVPDLIAAGARVIGGCCGTTPEHVRALAAACRGADNRPR
jgi:5-methyltetrahydrofolate--homocysteine methyltransferase